ncbi:MAG: threonine--tRNA ligase [Pseudomonas fluorescens]|nr:MAG: threonine--tRNA ligase [Pseudomonas fluorescens]
MVRITLPDASVREFDGTTTGAEVAASIGAGLAKAAVAVEVDGHPQDLSITISKDVSLKIATAKDALGLDTLRHTLAAQVLALAVKELYPSAKLAIGPTIDNGCYYDIEFSPNISSEDLPTIEAKMREIIASGRAVVRELWEPEKLMMHFESTGDSYKSIIIQEAVTKGQTIDGKVSAYRQIGSNVGGKEFIDLCRGPHVPELSKINLAFKLTNLAGAYWKGDSQNQQLTRIYCVAFATQKELDAYLLMREEAEKRDHRKLGRELELFHLQEEAPGQPFWHPKGWNIFLELEHFIRQSLRRYDYKEVNTPKLISKSLYTQSGHWQNYRENLFLTCDDVMQPIVEPAGHEKAQGQTLGELAKKMDDLGIYSLKPMNCPCHVQVFNQGTKSYRDLPLRMAEFGMCMRNEAHGALHGLMRVTSLTQDDAHIFCTPAQMEEEIIALCKLIDEVYEPLGFRDYSVKLATRPENRVGDDSLWDAAEKALEDACAKLGIPLTIAPGDGAFYGPKLEYHLKDAIGRTWQCGTVQVDFNLPIRMGANFTNENGDRVPCVMIHRAILGTLERFIGILIEQYEGKFPTWLSPVQAMVIPITDHQNDYAEQVRKALSDADVRTATGGLRVEVDASSDRMQKKILFAQQKKIPYMLVVGKQEAADGTVAIRLRDGTDLGAKPLAWLLERLKSECESRVDTPAVAKAA